MTGQSTDDARERMRRRRMTAEVRSGEHHELEDADSGHMHHATYTFIDNDHFKTTWTVRQRPEGTRSRRMYVRANEIGNFFEVAPKALRLNRGALCVCCPHKRRTGTGWDRQECLSYFLCPARRMPSMNCWGRGDGIETFAGHKYLNSKHSRKARGRKDAAVWFAAIRFGTARFERPETVCATRSAFREK